MLSSVHTRPVVISRRAWNKLRESLPGKPTAAAGQQSAATKVKTEEKPWPRSIQIAGYVAAGVGVPYFSLWLITSNPTLREWFGPYLPLDKLRSHFGHLEWDAQSYVDELLLEKQQEKIGGESAAVPVDFYQFPEEPTFRDRLQQRIIDTMEATNIKATVFVEEEGVVGSGGQSSSLVILEEQAIIPASTLARPTDLKAVLKGTLPMGGAVSVAVEFEDDDAADNDDNNSMVETMGGSLSSFDDDFPFSAKESQNPVTPLLQATHTFSSWYSIPVHHQQQQQQTSTSQSQSNDREMEISRLEYTISGLEANLKDPNCTRDIDDMVTELKQAKRQLSTLKWKRRLGL